MPSCSRARSIEPNRCDSCTGPSAVVCIRERRNENLDERVEHLWKGEADFAAKVFEHANAAALRAVFAITRLPLREEVSMTQCATQLTAAADGRSAVTNVRTAAVACSLSCVLISICSGKH